MSQAPIGSGLKLAITVDDLLLWDGIPIGPGYTHENIVESMVEDFARHGLRDIYSFSCTSPIEDDRAKREVIDYWVESGHHVGNHTHCHANLNFVNGKCYCEDVQRAEEYVGDLIEKAPQRYFRYVMDITGPSEKERGVVEDFLAKNSYTNAPISVWFDDVVYAFPYYRALINNDISAIEFVRKTFLESAIRELTVQSTLARTIFGRDIPQVLVIHATPIVKDILGELLSSLSKMQVNFVPLSSALKDPAYRAMPKVSPLFVNHLQRYAIMQGVPLDSIPLEEKLKLMQASPLEGYDSFEMGEAMLRKQCERINGNFSMDWMYASLEL